ncbi:acetylcholinesterase [Colletotrichum tabaci]|uniref:Carboxylic ester hydrolase n=1 Tax=Colletotrichum tabaci TaxID=1209068 RepID=A0AAV9STQ7_9PEZI
MEPTNALFLGLTLFLWCTVSTGKPFLPVVDLGYEVHQAISYNESTGNYNFTNIRYAQAPVGDLRFRAPEPPVRRNPVVQIGDQGRICPQAMPEWTLISGQFTQAFAAGNASSFDYSAAEEKARATMNKTGWPATWANPNSHTTEDCLIHGGAYVIGNKIYDNSADPSGLIRASQQNGEEGMIFISINYRLGALGWLAGPSLQASGGASNAGLLDQRLALNWIQEYIHMFGGDPDKVTVMGGSAGGGSIMHHITGYGGMRPPSFKGAITLSAGWVPISSQYQQESGAQAFLRHLNVTTIEEARSADTKNVILANALAIGSSIWTSFTYGPAVDGLLVPAQPGISLLKGEFDRNVSVMTGHTSNEGPYFSPPNVTTDEDLSSALLALYPGAQAPTIQYLLNDLYPTPGLNRTLELFANLGFTCNTDYLRQAFDNRTYNYEFRVAPGTHGTDFPYAFYSGPDPNETEDGIHVGSLGPVDVRLAQTLQGYITNFDDPRTVVPALHLGGAVENNVKVVRRTAAPTPQTGRLKG